MEPRRPPLPQRASAWILTGPLGHAYGGVVDWSLLAGRYAWARLRGRDPTSGA